MHRRDTTEGGQSVKPIYVPEEINTTGPLVYTPEPVPEPEQKPSDALWFAPGSALIARGVELLGETGILSKEDAYSGSNAIKSIVLALVEQIGISATAKKLGIPKNTVRQLYRAAKSSQKYKGRQSGGSYKRSNASYGSRYKGTGVRTTPVKPTYAGRKNRGATTKRK